MQFGALPHTQSIPVSPFTVSIPEARVVDLRDRLGRAVEIVDTYEGRVPDHQLGVGKSWVDDAVRQWKLSDWREIEKQLNSVPNFKAVVSYDDDRQLEIHFIALFSQRPDAVPIIMTHGWPGSIIEFLPLIKKLTSIYSPSTLPIHLVCPSLPGYAFSQAPPVDRGFSNADTAKVWAGLMMGLGFERYVAQGGDVGSRVTRLLARDSAGCVAIHVNAFHTTSPPDTVLETLDLDDQDQRLLAKVQHFNKQEYGYKLEQATKPSTLGIVVASDPIATLAWIGEKFLAWADKDRPVALDHVLANVSLYWLTRTFPTTLYPYPTSYGPLADSQSVPPEWEDKPVGYSLFPGDNNPFPVPIVKRLANVVWSKRHDWGGHFAALERPDALWEDIQAFLAVAWHSG